MLVLLVPAFFYFLPHEPSSQSSIPVPEEKSSSAVHENISGQVLKIASSDQVSTNSARNQIETGLAATVKSSREGVTQVHLENTGQAPLERVKVLEENGRTLGILSLLSPGEKKVLAMSGPSRRIKINAFDPIGREVLGDIRYETPSTIPVSFSGGLGGVTTDVKLEAKAAVPERQNSTALNQSTPAINQSNPAINQSAAATDQTAPAISQNATAINQSATAISQSDPAVSKVQPNISEASKLGIIFVANISQGHEGDVVGYRCTAKNDGGQEISDVKLFCEGRMVGTGFLTPGKELHLDGIHVIQDNTRLSAGVQGIDAEGMLWTNNTSIEIWKISPQLNLSISRPTVVHRGERFALDVKVENSGNTPLTEITVCDASGEIGKILRLEPGEAKALHEEMELQETLQDEVAAIAIDPSGKEIYASQGMEIRVLKTGLEIAGRPSMVTVYPGQPAEVTWDLSNTGEETLYNITLAGGDGKRCMLKELSPGRSVRMAAIYTVDSTALINVTAIGADSGGYAATAHGGVLIKAIQPGLSLKVTPGIVEVCPGEEAEISCLITNIGNDDLQDIVLYQQGSALATLDRLAPGDFRVVDSRTAVKDNTTIEFEVMGRDSQGQVWSDSAEVEADVVITALKVFASASPQSVVPGNTTRITCTVANTGSTPLYNVFVISKAFGPLGTIDSLLPKRQKTVSAEKVVMDGIEDSISAEGFTQQRNSVRSFCQLKIDVLKLPGMQMQGTVPAYDVAKEDDESSDVKVRSVMVRCGDMDIPLSLPSDNETAVRISEEIAIGVDSAAKESGNQVIDGISKFLGYIQKVLESVGGKIEPESEYESEYKSEYEQESELKSESEYGASTLQEENLAEDADDASASRNYELSIESVKGSEHGAIRIMDVSAVPSQPAAWEHVKLSVHVKSSGGVRAVSARWGLSDSPLTKTDMLGVDRVYELPMTLESGDGKDGYWSCTLPGNAAGTYMALSVWLTDGSSTAEGGPYMLHWSTVSSADKAVGKRAVAPQLEDGMLFIESTTVRGKGEVSIKDTFKGSAMEFNEKMKGNGSISLESLRCIDKRTADNFTEKKDLVFTDGRLKGHQRVSSPTFHGGMGASVTERFNLSHVDKSETSSVSAAGFANNTLAFNTEQAFDGTWNIQTQYAKFYKKIKADQQYTGSFQTEKKIKFQDAEQK